LFVLISNLGCGEKTDVVITQPGHSLLTLTSDQVLECAGRDWKRRVEGTRELEGCRGKILNGYSAGVVGEVKVQASQCFGVHDQFRDSRNGRQSLTSMSVNFLVGCSMKGRV
jgi:hypothetical protein